MEKERKIKVLSVVALIVAVLGLTIAFATLNSTLTIKGSANTDMTWDIHFENLGDVQTEGDAKVIKEPVLLNTSISDFSFLLKKPGDEIEFNFDIVNSGTIDAKIDKVLINGIVYEKQNYFEIYKSMCTKCDWNGDGETTEEEIRTTYDNIFIYLVFPEEVKAGQVNGGIDDSQNYGLSFEYYSQATALPKGDFELNGSVEFIYVQS